MNKKELLKSAKGLRDEITEINKVIKRLEKLGVKTKALKISADAGRTDLEALCSRVAKLRKKVDDMEKKALEDKAAKEPNNEGVKVKSGVSMSKKNIPEM